MATTSDKGESHGLSRWETLRQEEIADCRVFQVGRKICRHPRRGVEQDFYVIDSRDWIHVIARTADDKLVLVNQFRYGTEEFSLEVPGGIMEVGEDPVSAALRELTEETGYGGGGARLLGRTRPNPAVQSNWCHLVLAEGVRPVADLDWDEHEEIETVVLPCSQVFDLARTGAIVHSLTLAALFYFEPIWRASRPGI